jgi:hypothetical protein
MSVVPAVGQRSVRERVAREKSSNRPPDPVRRPHTPRDAVDQTDEIRVDRLVRPRAPTAGSLRPDRAAAAPMLDGTRVAVVRERVEMASTRLPEHRDQRRLGQVRNLPDGRDPAVAQLGRGDRPHAPEPLDRKRVQKVELPIRRHEEQAIRLRDGARHLGEELRPRDPDGDREPDPLAHLVTETASDLDRRADASLHPIDVEECLVDGEPFDHRCCVLEDPEHGLARVDVRREPRRHDDRLRTEPTCHRCAHRRADAERLGLVARGEDDAGADDHRPAEQARLVTLLDGREKRVEVGVQDRSTARLHERMFA